MLPVFRTIGGEYVGFIQWIRSEGSERLRDLLGFSTGKGSVQSQSAAQVATRKEGFQRQRMLDDSVAARNSKTTHAPRLQRGTFGPADSRSAGSANSSQEPPRLNRGILGR